MTKLKTEINGQPFEIEIEDGLTLEFSSGKLAVRRGDAGISYPPIPYYQPNWTPPAPNWIPPIVATYSGGQTTSGFVQVDQKIDFSATLARAVV